MSRPSAPGEAVADNKSINTDAMPTARPDPVLRARTLELLWHCHERNEEAERYGLVQAAQTPEGVLSIDYTPTEGGRLVTTGGDMCIRLWKVDESAIANWLLDSVCDMSACCRFLATMRMTWMPLTARWSPHGQMIASGHCEGKVCLWWRDMNSAVNHASSPSWSSTAQTSEGLVEEEWKDYRHLSGHISDVHDVCFSPDSRYLLTGAGDGSIVIHDLDGSPMPIVQLTDLHSKFCRGVAWDPWGRYIHTFGCGPALQCFTVVPRREGADTDKTDNTTAALNEDQPGPARHRTRRVRQLQLVNQRRCQGDFIGESCALSFRRLQWSPDGTLLAVPFGKLSRTAASTKATASASESHGQGRQSTDDIFAAIEARQKKETEASTPDNKDNDNDNDNDGSATSTAHGEPAAEREAATAAAASSPRTDDMLHCVQLYARGSTAAPVARLTVRGYSEIRGVQWAPCFLTPVVPSPFVDPTNAASGTGAAETVMVGVDVLPCTEAEAEGVSVAGAPARASAAHVHATMPDEEASSSSPAASTPAASTTHAYTSANGQATVTVSSTNAEAWSLTDYRMALAVWTSDAVVVYTTDQLVRHSDFTDLHMRSITDVAWNASATFLFTAALDGYVSVISMGDSLTLAYRLPSFSTRPMTQRLTAVLAHVTEEGAAVERGRVARREASRLAAEESARLGRQGESGGAGAAVVVVRKKKKVEAKPVADVEEVQIDQLEALMSGL